MTPVLRPYVDADFDAVLDVYRKCEDFLALGPEPRASAAMVREDLAASRARGGCFYCVCAGESVAGILDYLPGGYEGQPHVAYISLLMIGAPYRGAGLGRYACDWALRRARESEGVRELHASVQVNNAPAIAFWARMGFSRVSGPQPQPDGTVSFHLSRKLLSA